MLFLNISTYLWTGYVKKNGAPCFVFSGRTSHDPCSTQKVNSERLNWKYCMLGGVSCHAAASSRRTTWSAWWLLRFYNLVGTCLRWCLCAVVTSYNLISLAHPLLYISFYEVSDFQFSQCPHATGANNRIRILFVTWHTEHTQIMCRNLLKTASNMRSSFWMLLASFSTTGPTQVARTRQEV